MRKFNKGDMVYGTSNNYSWTDTKMTKGEVVKVNCSGSIMVEILEHEDGLEIGEKYSVNPKYFELFGVIKKGDTVELNLDANLHDLTDSVTTGGDGHWRGCQNSTLDFLRQHAGEDRVFKVTSITERHLQVKINGSIDLNVRMFKLVERKQEPKVTEVTMADLEKKYGTKVKVIK